MILEKLLRKDYNIKKTLELIEKNNKLECEITEIKEKIVKTYVEIDRIKRRKVELKEIKEFNEQHPYRKMLNEILIDLKVEIFTDAFTEEDLISNSLETFKLLEHITSLYKKYLHSVYKIKV